MSQYFSLIGVLPFWNIILHLSLEILLWNYSIHIKSCYVLKLYKQVEIHAAVSQLFYELFICVVGINHIKIEFWFEVYFFNLDVTFQFLGGNTFLIYTTYEITFFAIA